MSGETTPLDLEPIRLRADSAHVGKWATSAQELNESGFNLSPITCAGCGWDKPHDAADVEFITHARTDVPALVAEVERLRAVVDRVEALAEYYRSGRHGMQMWVDAASGIRRALIEHATQESTS